jgi:hypothetical protein
MIVLKRKPLSRRTLLRGAGVSMAIPLLDAMISSNAYAQSSPQRFFALFLPNGTTPTSWRPSAPGQLTAASLTPCLLDLAGAAQEGVYPGYGSLLNDVTVVSRCGHVQLNTGIHTVAMSLQAFDRGLARDAPQAPSLDVMIATKHRARFPYLSMSGTTSLDLNQGFITWDNADTPGQVYRSLQSVFNDVFGSSEAQAEIAARNASILDFVLEDAIRLQGELGQADRLRLEEYLESVRALEQQIQVDPIVCDNSAIGSLNGLDLHSTAKAYMDMAVLAFSCDLTRVATLQYSTSYSLNYGTYTAGSSTPDATGRVGLTALNDHLVSHKVGDVDRVMDLDALSAAAALQLANDRVILASRFKVRRFCYIVNKLKNTTTPTGNLLDDSLVLYCSENGNGDNHSRVEMPVLLAGRAGGFQPGRIVDAANQQTQGLHCAILNRFGFELDTYGNPAARPIAGL